MESTKTGVIYAFRQENGFGLLELEDGSEVLFDVTACVSPPVEGQDVRVVVGRSRAGEPRAVLVEPAGQPASTRPVRTLREALKRLRAEGLALELDDYELDAILKREGLEGEYPSELTRVLQRYYQDELAGERRRLADQYASWLESSPIEALVRELGRVIGGEHTAFAFDRSACRSVDDVVDALNEELRATGDARRIFALEGASGERSYLCMALARATRLAAVAVLSIRWGRPHLTPSEPPPRNA